MWSTSFETRLIQLRRRRLGKTPYEDCTNYCSFLCIMSVLRTGRGPFRLSRAWPSNIAASRPPTYHRALEGQESAIHGRRLQLSEEDGRGVSMVIYGRPSALLPMQMRSWIVISSSRQSCLCAVARYFPSALFLLFLLLFLSLFPIFPFPVERGPLLSCASDSA